MIKTMNSKMTTNLQLSTTELKTKQNKHTHLANSQNRNRITEMEITWRVISREWGRRLHRISINVRYKIDMRRLTIVGEMEKPKNLYVQPMDLN